MVRENQRKTADLSTALRSGRDDKLFQEDALSTQWKKGRELLNKFVISTGAKRSGEICGFSLVLPPSKARTYPEMLVQRVFPRPF
jgi:hypothetical protein